MMLSVLEIDLRMYMACKTYDSTLLQRRQSNPLDGL